MSVASDPVTLVIIRLLPDEHTGTGQRSRLLIEGACAAGPTHVLIVNDADVPLPRRPEFPGVASVTVLEGHAIDPKGALARISSGLARLVQPRRTYRANPGLRRAVLEIAREKGATALICRYTSVFCAVGVGAADGLGVFVDVDDRDDQKYRTRLAAQIGAARVESWPIRGLVTRLGAYLQTRLQDASVVWFTTAEDAWPLPGVAREILPNVPYWPVPDLSDRPPSSAPPTVLFVGTYAHQPNCDGVAWFVDACWPQIRNAVPEAQARIVGWGDWQEMQGRYPGVSGVQFVGSVEDIAEEYAGARLSICPVHDGGGSKIKVVESASFGRPAVMTSHSGRGFDGLAELDAPQSNEAAAFAEACIGFLADGARADRAGQALKAWQDTAYSRPAFVASVAATLKTGAAAALNPPG